VKKRALILILILIALFAVIALVSCAQEVTVTGIEIYTSPKLRYLQGEEFDLNGAQIRVKRSDGSTHLKDVTPYMHSSFDPWYTETAQVITISYEGKNCFVFVNVAPNKVGKAWLGGEGFKDNYIQGQLFLEDGLFVYVLFGNEDGDFSEIPEGHYDLKIPLTAEMVSGYDRTKHGLQRITATFVYDGITHTVDEKANGEPFIITVAEKVLTSIIVSKLPAKEIYYQGEELDLAGGEITLNYNNGIPEVIFMNGGALGLSFSANMNVIPPNNASTPVIVSYGGFHDTFSIRVVEEDVAQYILIQAPQPPPSQSVGTPLDISWLRFQPVYSNGRQGAIYTFGQGSTVRVCVDGVNGEIPIGNYDIFVKGFNPDKVGFQEVEIGVYSGTKRLSTTFKLELFLTDKNVESLEIFRTRSVDSNGNPLQDKPIYVNTPFTPFHATEGWAFRVSYSNGTNSGILPLTQGMFGAEHEGKTEFVLDFVGKARFFIRYHDGIRNDLTIEYELDVLPVAVTSILLSDANGSASEPIRIFRYESINTNGFFIKAFLNNGKEVLFPLTPAMVGSFDNSNLVLTDIPIVINIAEYQIYSHNASVPARVVKRVLGMEFINEPISKNFLLYNPSDPDNLHNYLFNPSGIEIRVFFGGDNGQEAEEFYSLDSQSWIFSTNGEAWTNDFSTWFFTKPFASGIYSEQRTVKIAHTGLQDINVGYLEFSVTVRNFITHIELPNGSLGRIYSGSVLDLAGGLGTELLASGLTLRFENRTSLTVPLSDPNIIVEGYNPSQHTSPNINYAIRVRYAGATLDHNTYPNNYYEAQITVIANPVIGIEVYAPHKTKYVLNDSPNWAGLEVFLLNASGTRTGALFHDNPNIEITGFDSRTVTKENLITVRYSAGDSLFFTGSFTVEIASLVPIRLEWASGTPRIELIQNIDFVLFSTVLGQLIAYPTANGLNLWTLDVIITYSDNTTRTTVPLGELAGDGTSLRVVGYNKANTGTQNPQLYYQDLSGDCWLPIEVNVTPRQLHSVHSTQAVFNVIEGMDLNLLTARLRIVFNNGDEYNVPLMREHIQRSANNPFGYDKDSGITGNNIRLDIRYELDGLVAWDTVVLNIAEKQLINIAIRNMPKYMYVEHEAFSIRDDNGELGSITLYYNNGTIRVADFFNASIGTNSNSNSDFYINIERFNNSELDTGAPPVSQRIFIYWNEGRRYETHYDIIMRDRRNASPDYEDSSPVYEFIYGEIGQDMQDRMPKIGVSGFTSYDQSTANAFADWRFTVEYVPHALYNLYESTPSMHGQFLQIPTEAGLYYIIVSYNSLIGGIDGFGAPTGGIDLVHNSFKTTSINSKRLEIKPRNIYIGLEDSSKIYGQDMPKLYLYAVGSSPSGTKDENAKPFAFNESFNSVQFAEQTSGGYALYFMISGSEYSVSLFNLVALRNLVNHNLSNTTNAGIYELRLSSAISNNYNIIYEDGCLMEIFTRDVFVTPENIVIEYGPVQGVSIPWQASAVKDGQGNNIPNTGLFADEFLNPNGSLTFGRILDDGTETEGMVLVPGANMWVHNVGLYDILRGTLGLMDINYNVILDKGFTVEVVPRNLYVTVSGASKIFGEENPSFSVTYNRFIDGAPNGGGSYAFAYPFENMVGLTVGALGRLNFTCLAETLSDAGVYQISAEFTEVNAEGVWNAYNNYIIHYASANLTILQKEVSVLIHNAFKEFGDNDPIGGFTAVFNGHLTELIGILKRTAGEEMGDYYIDIDDIISKNTNYSFSVLNDGDRGIFQIIVKQLYVKFAPSDLEKVYDGKVAEVKGFMLVDNPLSEVPFAPQGFNRDSVVRVSLDNPLRGRGNYPVVITNLDRNYNVSSADGMAHSFEILGAPISFNDIIFELPDGEEYSGNAFGYSARINPAVVRLVYNEFGQEIGSDSVSVVLQLVGASTVLNAGGYSVRILSITGGGANNYTLEDYEISQGVFVDLRTVEVSFEILQKVLEVRLYESLLLTLESDNGNTAVFTTVYSSQNIRMERNAGDFGVYETNGTPWDISFNVAVRLTEGRDDWQPSDVKYLNGEIDSYLVYTFQHFNTNYLIQLDKEYYVKILPRLVLIDIPAGSLIQPYNGQPPAIRNLQIGSDSGFTSDMIDFVFTPTDGQVLGDAGRYAISVSTQNLNHTVRLLADFYQFEITKATVNVRIEQHVRPYSGMPWLFELSTLALPQTAGTPPRIRNYRLESEFDIMDSFLTELMGLLNDSRGAFNRVIVPSPLSLVIDRANTAQSELTRLYDKIISEGGIEHLKKNDNGTDNSNYNEIISLIAGAGTNTLFGRLTELLHVLNTATDFSEGSTSLAQATALITVLNGLMSSLNALILKELNYIAFIVTPRDGGADSSLKDAGTYNVVLRGSRDPNRIYNLQSNNVVTITALRVDIYVDNLYMEYGTVDWKDGEDEDRFQDLGFTYRVMVNGVVTNAFDSEIVGKPVLSPSAYTLNDKTDAGKLRVIQGGYGIDMSSFANKDKHNLDIFITSPGRLHITRKVAYIQLTQNIGSGLGEDNPLISYGTDLEYMLLMNRWTYLPSYVVNGGTVEGGILAGDIWQSVIMGAGARYILWQGENIILNMDTVSAQPRAGQYTLTATGFLANNYEIMVLEGTLVVKPAVLEIDAGFSNLLSREYGDLNFSITYKGFRYNDAENLGFLALLNSVPINEFVAFWNSEDEGGGGNVRTGVNSGIHSVGFNTPIASDYGITDYIFVFEGEYDFEIVRARLDIEIRTAGGIKHIEFAYGMFAETNGIMPVKSTEFALFIGTNGYRNNDNADNSKLNSLNPLINFKKNVFDTGLEFDLGAGRFTFGENDFATHENYEFNVISTPFTVTRAELSVELDKELNIRLTSSNTSTWAITPYMVSNEIRYEEVEDPETGETDIVPIDFYEVHSGYYWHRDFIFTWLRDSGASTLLPYGEQYFNIFRTESGQGGAHHILGREFTPTHTIDSPTALGKVNLSLGGFSLACKREIPCGTNNCAHTNYTVKETKPVKANVYSQITEMAHAEQEFILLRGEGGSVDFGKIVVEFLTESGLIYRRSITASEIRMDGGLPSNMANDSNESVVLWFQDQFALNILNIPRFDKMPIGSEWENGTFIELNDFYTAGFALQTVGDLFNLRRTLTNLSDQYDFILRVFSQSSQHFTHDFVLGSGSESLVYGKEINVPEDTYAQFVSVTAGTGNYDVIDSAFKFIPNSVHNFSFTLLINGSMNADSLMLVIGGIGANIVAIKDSVPTFIPINLSGINLFNGFTHTIKIYYNKFTNTILIVINDESLLVSVPFDAYTATDNSETAFDISGLRVWVRHFNTMRQGYKDDYGTLVLPHGSQSFVYVAEGFDSVYLPLENLFNIKTPKAEGYTLSYLFNNNPIALLTYANPFADTMVNPSLGVHTAELRVYLNGNLISHYVLTLIVTHSYKSATILAGEVITEHNPVEIPAPNQIRNIGITPSSSGTYSSVSLSFSVNNTAPDSDSESVFYAKFGTNEAQLTNNAYIGKIWQIPVGLESYYNSVLALVYNEAIDNYEATIYLSVNRKTAYFDLPSIDWNSGAIYTADLYYDAFSRENSGARVVFELYENGVLLYSYIFDSRFEFTGYVVPTGYAEAFTASDFFDLCLNKIGRTAGISASNMILNLSRALFNTEHHRFNYDFTLGGNYVQRVSEAGFIVPQNQKFAVANSFGEMALRAVTQASLTFTAEENSGSNLRFVIASTEKNVESPTARSLSLIYDHDLRTLYFAFVYNGTEFRLQPLATNVNLFNGSEQTISVSISRLAVFGDIAGFSVAPAYSEVFVSFNGTPLSVSGKFPTTSVPSGWIFGQNNSIHTEEIENDTNFVTPFGYTYLIHTNANGLGVGDLRIN